MGMNPGKTIVKIILREFDTSDSSHTAGTEKVENLLKIHYTYRHANSSRRDTPLYDTKRP